MLERVVADRLELGTIEWQRVLLQRAGRALREQLLRASSLIIGFAAGCADGGAGFGAAATGSCGAGCRRRAAGTFSAAGEARADEQIVATPTVVIAAVVLLDHADAAALIAIRLIRAAAAGRACRSFAGHVIVPPHSGGRSFVFSPGAQHARGAAAIAAAARGGLRAALARGRIREVVLRAVRRHDRVERDVEARRRARLAHRAAAEAVAAGRRDRAADHHALRAASARAERGEALGDVVLVASTAALLTMPTGRPGTRPSSSRRADSTRAGCSRRRRRRCCRRRSSPG